MPPFPTLMGPEYGIPLTGITRPYNADRSKVLNPWEADGLTGEQLRVLFESQIDGFSTATLTIDKAFKISLPAAVVFATNLSPNALRSMADQPLQGMNAHGRYQAQFARALFAAYPREQAIRVFMELITTDALAPETIADRLENWAQHLDKRDRKAVNTSVLKRCLSLTEQTSAPVEPPVVLQSGAERAPATNLLEISINPTPPVPEAPIMQELENRARVFEERP